MPLASQIELPARYRVARHIASGGMASVWEAEDQLLGRIVAVKVLGAQFAGDPGARARFQREARTAAQVADQRNVVTIYDIGEHGADAFIVMEYFAGGTVADRLRDARKSGEPIPRETSLRWLREAAAGLDVAHAAGIVHRDVKPANLLLDAQGRLAVADFGIARLADDTQMTQTGQVLGTAAYISPEQARGLPATDASDRYALAVVAFELLTGSRPFEGGPPTAQALAHAESPPPRPSDASPELPRAIDAVLARGLAKDPAERPASAGELVAALEDALNDDVADATEPTRRLAVAPVPAEPQAAIPQPQPATPPPPIAPAAMPKPSAPRAAQRPRVITPQPPRPPAPPAGREAGGPPPEQQRRQTAGLVAALVAVVVVVALVLALSGGDPKTTATRDSTPTKTQASGERTSTTPAAEQPATPPPPAASKLSPAALNDQGHRLIEQERYGEAVAPLQASVAAYREAGDKQLPYAFALFNLGVALNRSGNPQAAVGVLQERLGFDNQRATVQAELDAALAKLGEPTSGDAKPGKGNGKGNKGRG